MEDGVSSPDPHRDIPNDIIIIQNIFWSDLKLSTRFQQLLWQPLIVFFFRQYDYKLKTSYLNLRKCWN